jgi:hypothetical protein
MGLIHNKNVQRRWPPDEQPKTLLGFGAQPGLVDKAALNLNAEFCYQTQASGSSAPRNHIVVPLKALLCNPSETATESLPEWNRN